jgi:hypothetical protein
MDCSTYFRVASNFLSNRNDSKRSGPGRKSNAEHAINFYQYILQLDAQEQSSITNDSKHPNENVKYVEIDGNKTMELQDFLDQHNDLCEVCSQGGDLLCCNTCNLVFHLLCSRPKLTKMPADNWNCSFCIASGITGHKRESRVRRRASSAVREMLRLKRSLPNTENEEVKQSDASTNSLRSVVDDARHQDDNNPSPNKHDQLIEKDQKIDERMEIELQDTKMTETTPVKNKDIQEEENNSMAVEEIIVEQQTMHQEKDDTDKKHFLNLNMTTNSVNPNDGGDRVDVVATETVDQNDSTNKRKRDLDECVLESDDGQDGPTRKIRRLRRQPILYDPQTCAASEWQSDGVFEWKTLSPSERGIPNSQLSSGTTTEAAKRKSMLDTKGRDLSRAKYVDDFHHDENDNDNNPLRDSIWCNFCRDDPTIPVCCFCGCRTCYGKHNKVNDNY